MNVLNLSDTGSLFGWKPNNLAIMSISERKAKNKQKAGERFLKFNRTNSYRLYFYTSDSDQD